jgi:hypothetical protein
MPIDYSVFEPRVFYGAVLGAVLSLYLALALKSWLVIVLFGLFVGIGVDVAAHNYQH